MFRENNLLQINTDKSSLLSIAALQAHLSTSVHLRENQKVSANPAEALEINVSERHAS